MDTGKAIIFSAPSGSGKTTIVKHLLAKFEEFEFSVSATTRPRRIDREIDGRDYYFLSAEEFKTKISKGDFVEWEEVYDGNYYGTLKSEIDRIWQDGKHVLFDVDVKGGLMLNQYFKERGLSVFVKVKNIIELEKRLRHRNTETEEVIRRRLDKAVYEMSFENQFDVTLVSDELESTLRKAEKLVMDFIDPVNR
jgi:guanylate kinase